MSFSTAKMYMLWVGSERFFFYSENNLFPYKSTDMLPPPPPRPLTGSNVSLQLISVHQIIAEANYAGFLNISHDIHLTIWWLSLKIRIYEELLQYEEYIRWWAEGHLPVDPTYWACAAHWYCGNMQHASARQGARATCTHISHVFTGWIFGITWYRMFWYIPHGFHPFIWCLSLYLHICMDLF
jgi:hypothetical protein